MDDGALGKRRLGAGPLRSRCFAILWLTSGLWVNQGLEWGLFDAENKVICGAGSDKLHQHCYFDTDGGKVHGYHMATYWPAASIIATEVSINKMLAWQMLLFTGYADPKRYINFSPNTLYKGHTLLSFGTFLLLPYKIIQPETLPSKTPIPKSIYRSQQRLCIKRICKFLSVSK